MKKMSVSFDSSIPIPDFTLPSTEGGRILGSRDFRQHSNLVILLMHSWSCDSCRRLVASLHDRREFFSWLDIRVVVIVEEPLIKLAGAEAVLGPEMTLLADEDGKVTASFREGAGNDHPLVVIADRFGAIFEKMELDEGEEIDFGEMESTLLFIATLCPECGRPDGESTY